MGNVYKWTDVFCLYKTTKSDVKKKINITCEFTNEGSSDVFFKQTWAFHPLQGRKSIPRAFVFVLKKTAFCFLRLFKPKSRARSSKHNKILVLK